jgi:hypothetical protein
LVPPRVVVWITPPVNCPRAMSYVLVTTRVLRMASCGTAPAPNEMPSRVMLFWSARWPATEKLAAVLSVPTMPTYARREQRDRVDVARVDGEPQQLLAVERARGGAGRGALVGTRRVAARLHLHGAQRGGDGRQRGVGHEAVLVGVAREREVLRRHADGADDDRVLPAAVGEEQRVLPLLVGGLGALEPRLDARHLHARAGDRLPCGPMTVPTMMSVLLPTCASAVAASVALAASGGPEEQDDQPEAAAERGRREHQEIRDLSCPGIA